MLNIEERHLRIIKDILSNYPYGFHAFGSRVQGTNRPFSDIDICAMKEIPWLAKSHLEEEFEQSNLPFKVDIIEWNKLSKEFQQMIRKDFYPL
jgi:type I restriction enzyme S subunit